MNARLTALAAIITVGIAAPMAAQAGTSSAPRCGSIDQSHDFLVSASSEVRNVKAGNHWTSTAVVQREVASQTTPAAQVAVTLAVRTADGHWTTTTAQTDALGRATLDIAIPRGAKAGFATAQWSATEQIDAPCGPRVDTYGEYTIAKAVRVIR